jgi:His/Glu/Gln/Arg/opine family amino acid ABC transporter permease subunit
MFDLDGYWLSLLAGTWITVKLTAWSLGIGLGLGLIGAVSMVSGIRFLSTIADAVTTVIRGIPELLFILAVYLGSSVLMPLQPV